MSARISSPVIATPALKTYTNISSFNIHADAPYNALMTTAATHKCWSIDTKS